MPGAKGEEEDGKPGSSCYPFEGYTVIIGHSKYLHPILIQRTSSLRIVRKLQVSYETSGFF